MVAAHHATYFVESAIIHAKIGGHTLLSPLGNRVRALLLEQLLQQRQVTNRTQRWLSSRWLTSTEPGHYA